VKRSTLFICFALLWGCSRPAVLSTPQNKSLYFENKGIKVRVSRLRHSEEDFELALENTATGSPIDLSQRTPSVRWSESKRTERSRWDASIPGLLRFKMTRGKYCWDGHFLLTLHRTASSEAVEVPFEVSELCEADGE
jgi:hypothetical protein